MANGCRQRCGSDWAIAITGIAGPGGATQAKPVGLVYIGLAGPDVQEVHRQIMPGTRDIVRLRASLAAMNYLRLHLLAK
jgi:nicotinamide-nucleotide amidase